MKFDYELLLFMELYLLEFCMALIDTVIFQGGIAFVSANSLETQNILALEHIYLRFFRPHSVSLDCRL